MACRMCGVDAPLVKSHVIPKSFYRIDRDEPHPLKVISNTPGVRPKRVPMGLYDPKIVCDKCENGFGLWDDYAHRLLIRDTTQFVPIRNGRVTVGLQLPRYDYQKLKLFFLSMLWRAAVSTLEQFKKVKLGPHEDRLGDLIVSNDPGRDEDFSVSLAAFDCDAPMLDPHHERFEGVNFVRLYFGNYIPYVKIDKRPTPTFFRELSLRPDKPLIIICRDFNKSKERKLIQKMLASNPDLWNH